MAGTLREPRRPVFWIVAGPNGSGKSTLYNRTDIEGWSGSVWIINPDLLTAKIVEQEGLPLGDANLAAVRRIEQWLESSIGVETVLSFSKYRRLAEAASTGGFETRMIYVVLDTLERQLERIRERVASGGHDVPADKVAARRIRSFEQLAWFVRKVDRCVVFVNSGDEPELAAASVNRGPLWRFGELPEELEKILVESGVDIRDAE